MPLASGLALAVLLAATAGAAADAAQLVEVRVGRHPEFVRVVFETDAPATFSIEPGGAPGETLVRLDAERTSLVASRSGADEAGADVLLEPLPDGATLARIRATVPVRVESQVLDEPPRVVLDLRSAGDSAEPALLPPSEPAAPAADTAVPLEAPRDAEPPGVAEDEDRVAALLAKLPADPAPPELPLDPDSAALADPTEAPEWPEASERSPPPEPRAQDAAPPPPVSSAPPAAITSRFDERSLVIGGVSGLVLGVGLSLMGRRSAGPGQRRKPAPSERREEAVAREVAAIPREQHPAPPPGPAPIAPGDEASAPAGAADPLLRRDPFAADLLQMIHGLDDRSARGSELVAGLRERVERLDHRTRAQGEELAAQRQALARLQRALGRPPVRLAADESPRPRES